MAINQVLPNTTFNDWRVRTNEIIDWLNNETTNNNFAGNGPPGSTDDINAGYNLGSIWLDIVSTPKEGYRCVDNTAGVAIWLNTTLEVGDLGSMAIQDANSVNISGGTVKNITDILVADGGTGSSTPAGARTNLGVYSIAEVNAVSASDRVYADSVAADNAVAMAIALG